MDIRQGRVSNPPSFRSATMMRFHVLTLFPEMFDSPLSVSIIARAQKQGLVEVNLHNIRDFTHNRHNTVDDYPFGGGPGMVMKPEPLFESVEHVRGSASLDESAPTVLMTPQGRRFDQRIAEDYSELSDIVIICGRYEGVDERVRQNLVTDELSIGDYVLGGGELAAMVVIDAVARLIPGVVGSAESPANDSYTTGLLQHPLYTRPPEYRGMEAPDVLLSGHHAEIAKWHRRETLRRTLERRPDLLESADLSNEDRRMLDELRAE
jgi:tRNA (guanine37-N1)-methyltransferase